MTPLDSFRSRHHMTSYTIPASTEHFSIACNAYKLVPDSSKDARSRIKTLPILFAHANGFHKEVWEPVMARLGSPWCNSDMYALDLRNMGESAVLNKDVLEDQCNWYWYARDVLKMIDTFGLKNVIGVGHSVGASAFILAESLRPGTFSSIIAIEPTMFPDGWYVNLPLAENPMGQATLRRRDVWKDRLHAREDLLSKKFFRAIHPEAFEIYLEHGMLEGVKEDGSTFLTLKGPKFQEAITFANEGNAVHDAFNRLADLHIPVYLILGETSDINPPALGSAKLKNCKYGSLDVVKGSGHLVCLEKPEEVTILMSAFLDGLSDTHRTDAEFTKSRL
ncbi:hypothetical protein EMPS_04390 [Entomortierella parvispora]|uniref:AB hydrolase-1 domain-containing protein n=1 Tax=Entomortierella parvispora TaxID=205924 RepID=A0A9P3H937_9FUNG|nr:hypothetical protein EMPS_04390 [Entomortierella parvispora]